MSNKQTKPKPRLPKGLRDIEAQELRGQKWMFKIIERQFERYGFEPLQTPAFEYADALGKFLPDDDRPNEGVFSFEDDDAQWLSLRYDLTAPLARYVAQNYDRLPKPFRRYQSGPVWRNEKPGPGRYREFMQFDADTVGAPTGPADAEICMLAAECLEQLGIARGDFAIRINNRKILDGVLSSIGLDREDQTYRQTQLTILRAIDKLDRLGADGVRDLLGPGRKDQSGDFTKGAGLAPDEIKKLIAFTEVGGEQGGKRTEVLGNLRALVGDNETGLAGIAELELMDQLFTAAGFAEDRIIFDPSVVRGLDYYTGPVFEAELLFEVKDEKDNLTRFGSIGGGGRYDDLVKRFKGIEIPATGFSFGVSRLYAALEASSKLPASQITQPVVVLVLDRDNLADYQAMVQELRGENIRAEMYLGAGSMKAQLKYADKRGCPIAIIQGEDERAKAEVTLKDLVLGAEISSGIKDNREWRKDQPAQKTISRDTLIDGVKAMLARIQDTS